MARRPRLARQRNVGEPPNRPPRAPATEHAPPRHAADPAPTTSDRPVVTPIPLADGGTELVATRDFRVRRYALKQRFELRPAGRFCTVTVVAGSGTLWWPGERVNGTLTLATGDTALVPACCPRFDLIPNESMNVLVCDPGVR